MGGSRAGSERWHRTSRTFQFHTLCQRYMILNGFLIILPTCCICRRRCRRRRAGRRHRIVTTQIRRHVLGWSGWEGEEVVRTGVSGRCCCRRCRRRETRGRGATGVDAEAARAGRVEWPFGEGADCPGRGVVVVVVVVMSRESFAAIKPRDGWAVQKMRPANLSSRQARCK